MARKDISDYSVIKACKEWQGIEMNPESSIDILMRVTGQCYKVCLRAMERAQKRGLIECGVSIHRSWPTTAGLCDVALSDTWGAIARSHFNYFNAVGGKYAMYDPAKNPTGLLDQGQITLTLTLPPVFKV